MLMSNSPDIRHKLEQLRPRFLEMVAERLERFQCLRNQLHATDDTALLLDEIRNGAHRMAGMAATLGFASLGAFALSVDMMIGRLRADGGHPTPTEEILDAIDLLIGEMRQCVFGGTTA